MNKRVFQCLYIVLFSLPGLAQTGSEKHSLQSVLEEVEARHPITFAYGDENIKDIFIVSPPEGLSVTEVLEYLRENTGLEFQQLNQRYVTISKSKANTHGICGFLADSQNGVKIAGATVQCENKIAISDESGYFELKGLLKNSGVSIKSLGYQTVNFAAGSVGSKPCKTITLTLEIRTLPEVIIRNYITEGISKKVDGSIAINSLSLGILPGLVEADVLQTIQALPGIQSIDETVSNINVRGGNNDQNLVLWEGIKMYQSGHFFGLISAFNPYLTREISLIKNGTNAFYGDGVSSTIDIRSDDQIAQHLSGGAGINLLNADGFLHVPLFPKTSLQISGRRSIADAVHTPTYSQYFKRAFRETDVILNSNDTLINNAENFQFYDFSLKFLYDISDRDKLRVNLLHLFNDIEYQENSLVNNFTESKTSGLNQKSLGAGISYLRQCGEKLKLSSELYFSSYDLMAVNFDIFNDQRLIQENKVLDTGLKLTAVHSLTNNLEISNGYQLTEAGVTNLEDINNPRYRRVIKKVLRSHAAFTSMNISSNSNNSNLRAGVRANYFEKFRKLIMEPRLSFNQKISDHLSLEILGEMKSQTTTQTIDFQNDFLGIEKRRWVLSDNEDIPIVKSRQLSAGLHYINPGLIVSVEAYHKQVQGITTSSQGFQNQLQFVHSVGNYDVTGIDLLLNKKLNRITAWFSYSLAKNTFEFKDLVPTVFPANLDINHAATLGCSYQSQHLKLSAGVNWHSGKPFTEPFIGNSIVDNEINFQEPNSSRLNDYTRADISGVYVFQLSRGVNASAGFSIWNILDKENIVDRYYQINQNDQVVTHQRKALGFTPNLMFRVDF